MFGLTEGHSLPHHFKKSNRVREPLNGRMSKSVWLESYLVSNHLSLINSIPVAAKSFSPIFQHSAVVSCLQRPDLAFPVSRYWSKLVPVSTHRNQRKTHAEYNVDFWLSEKIEIIKHTLQNCCQEMVLILMTSLARCTGWAWAFSLQEAAMVLDKPT